MTHWHHPRVLPTTAPNRAFVAAKMQAGCAPPRRRLHWNHTRRCSGLRQWLCSTLTSPTSRVVQPGPPRGRVYCGHVARAAAGGAAPVLAGRVQPAAVGGDRGRPRPGRPQGCGRPRGAAGPQAGCRRAAGGAPPRGGGCTRAPCVGAQVEPRCDAGLLAACVSRVKD